MSPVDTKARPMNTSSHIFTKPLGELEVGPHQQPHLSLGTFDDEVSPKGFSIEVNPSPDPEGSVITQVATLKKGNHYELVLQVANYGDKPVHAAVWAF